MIILTYLIKLSSRANRTTLVVLLPTLREIPGGRKRLFPLIVSNELITSIHPSAQDVAQYPVN